MRHFAEYLLELSSTPLAPVVLVAHSFLESFVLPLAHELFLIPISLARPQYSFLFALMSTVASVCGISVGYAIGKYGGKGLIVRIIQPRRFIVARRYIHNYDAWAVAIACFTPIPVKVFALVAGAINLHFKKMIVIAFFARGARYFLVSTLLYFYGAEIREWILDYLNLLMLGLFLVIFVPFVIWKITENYIIKKSYTPA